MLTTLQDKELTLTDNGDVAHLTTGKKNLDLFGLMGSLRGRHEALEELFQGSFREDPLVAIAQLFYLRDVRGGVGERDSFRTAFVSLASSHPDKAQAFASVLPEVVSYGRWDDLVHIMVNTDGLIREKAAQLIRSQWEEDKTSEHPSLLAKWLPSPNASSERSKAQAKAVRKVLGLRESEYRRALTALRSKLNLVENALRTRTLEDVDYASVPSRAMHKYGVAFRRNDRSRFTSYLESLVSGEQKAKTDGLYPHEIVGRYFRSDCYVKRSASVENTELLEAQWEAMKNALIPEDAPLTLPVFDGSASMYSNFLRCSSAPIIIAAALTLLMSEQLPGDLRNQFAVFSDRAYLEKISGDTLAERIDSLLQFDDIAGSTNLDAAFDLVYEHNQKEGVCPIERIVIPSDMQFNAGMVGGSAYERALKKFEKGGVLFPKVVFWQVNAQRIQYPSTDLQNIQLVSGFSKAVLADVMGGGRLSALAYMLETLSRYSGVAEKFMANLKE